MEHHSCAFTGHRTIQKNHLGKIQALVARAIAYAYGKGVRVFYTGGAVGFDTVAAKEVLKFRLTHRDVKLHILIPCKNQSEKWNKFQIEIYDYILSEADFVEFVCESYTKDCMKKRNMRLVQSSDMLIAYVSKNQSGAAQTLRLAMNSGLEIYNLYPTLDSQI